MEKLRRARSIYKTLEIGSLLSMACLTFSFYFVERVWHNPIDLFKRNNVTGAVIGAVSTVNTDFGLILGILPENGPKRTSLFAVVASDTQFGVQLYASAFAID
jgi:hypothetical protein